MVIGRYRIKISALTLKYILQLTKNVTLCLYFALYNIIKLIVVGNKLSI